jgi:hypothetical protein
MSANREALLLVEADAEIFPQRVVDFRDPLAQHPAVRRCLREPHPTVVGIGRAGE